jgi:hypothetical protein
MSPRICWSIEPCDYAARAPALRLLAAEPDGYARALDDVMAHPRLREIVDCLTRMATAGFLEYYFDDRWSFDTTIAREVALAEDLEAPEWRFGTSTWGDDVGDPFAG